MEEQKCDKTCWTRSIRKYSVPMYNDDTHGNADMSPTCTNIFVPTRSAFVLVTKDSFVFLVTNLNIKNVNVC